MKFDVSIQLNVELEDSDDLGQVLSQLMCTPSISGGTAKLCGINVYNQPCAPVELCAGGATLPSPTPPVDDDIPL